MSVWSGALYVGCAPEAKLSGGVALAASSLPHQQHACLRGVFPKATDESFATLG